MNFKNAFKFGFGIMLGAFTANVICTVVADCFFKYVEDAKNETENEETDEPEEN